MVSIFKKEFQISFVRRCGSRLQGCIGVVGISYVIPEESNEPPLWLKSMNLVDDVLRHGCFKGKQISKLDGALILDTSDPLCSLIGQSDVLAGLFEFNGKPTTEAIGNLIASLICEQADYAHNMLPMEICFSVNGEHVSVEL
jgi:hypothetical protein